MYPKFVTSVFLLLTLSIFAQNEINIKSDSSATVYIIRTSSIGVLVPFDYFVDDQFVGTFTYGKYLKLTIPSGNHIIWAKSENRSFIDAILEPNKTYVINTIPQFGLTMARVKLTPKNSPNDYEIRLIKKYIRKKKLEKGGMDNFNDNDYIWLKKEITNGLEKYKELKIKKQEIETLNMPIDLSDL